MNLSSPVESIPRVSAAYQKRLNRLGIKTIKNLLYHFPHRYEDLSNIVKIADIKVGEIATIHGEIINIKMLRTFKKKMWLVEALIKDETETIRAVWYNQPFLIRTLKKGVWVSLAGKALSDGKTLHFSNPSHEKLPTFTKEGHKKLPPFTKGGQGGFSQGTHTGRLVPMYPETAKLTSKWLRYILKIVLPETLPQINDFLPNEIKKTQKLAELKDAIGKIHSPETQEDINIARRRLGFDELFLIQLYVLEQKQKWQKNSAPEIKFNQPLIKNFVDSLPFKLTDAQRKSAWEILQDMEKPKPMNRLLEGDVGSGKTVVAAIAALETARAGLQTAFMAPTEILAQQHFTEITKLTGNFNITIGLLTSSDAKIYSGAAKNKSRRPNKTSSDKSALIKKIGSGEVQIIIGTHSLIQEKIRFRNLGLAIVDEQHRFGVGQRAALQKNISAIKDETPKQIPHLLSMTATPIPRTLALTIYGDLDLSFINEMPKGRQKIITKIVEPKNRQKAYDFIKEQIKSGRQAFVICPRIEAANREAQSANRQNEIFSYDMRYAISDKRKWNDAKTVTEEYKKLSEKIFPDLKINMLHGKIKQKEKEKIMQDFRDKKYDILVSTSVVEVGVDIPNASVMVIEGAERFGLAQLYQFRGRVGRGAHQSYCFLFAESSSPATSQRLKAVVAAQSGFELAEKDLELRGPGEFWGAQQWGLPDLAMASLADRELIKSCRSEAEKILAKDPELKNFPSLKEKLSAFKSIVHLE